jgi:hypothetical protein
MSGGLPESVADTTVTLAEPQIVQAERKVKRKASAYAKKYGKAFKKIQKKYKTKAGKWKKDGFKRAQKEAHKLAKRMR